MEKRCCAAVSEFSIFSTAAASIISCRKTRRTVDSRSSTTRTECRITLSGRAPNGSLDSRLATGALPIGSVSDVNLNDPRNVRVLAVLPDNKTSNVQQFNVQVQRQLTGSTALSVGYVGTRGRNLVLYYNLNGRIIEPGTNVLCPRGNTSVSPCYPTLAGNHVDVRDDNGKSQYDSLQVQLERRFTRGWQYRAAYTFSKTKDNGEGAFDAVGDTNINFIEPYTTSRIDFPHVFSFETVYDIPFGRGRQFGTDLNPGLNALIGGWQINGFSAPRADSPSTFGAMEFASISSEKRMATAVLIVT